MTRFNISRFHIHHWATLGNGAFAALRRRRPDFHRPPGRARPCRARPCRARPCRAEDPAGRDPAGHDRAEQSGSPVRPCSGAVLDHVSGRTRRGWSPSKARSRGAAPRSSGAHFLADARNPGVTPPATAVVEYRITAIVPELAQYDPTHNREHLPLHARTVGRQYQLVAAGLPRRYRRPPASRIPLAATWDEHGDRIESSSGFTFRLHDRSHRESATAGGYRPVGHRLRRLLTAMHWTCHATRTRRLLRHRPCRTHATARRSTCGTSFRRRVRSSIMASLPAARDAVRGGVETPAGRYA